MLSPGLNVFKKIAYEKNSNDKTKAEKKAQ